MKSLMLVALTTSSILLVSILPQKKAYAWGPQGHHIATRVAVRLLMVKTNRDAKAITPFQSKELMLAHLANIPDKYWRSLPKEMTTVGNPSHYLDLEIASTQPSFETISDNISKTYKAAIAGCKAGGKDQLCPKNGFKTRSIAKSLGSAPWRINQFWLEMKTQFNIAKKQEANLKKDPKNKKSKDAYTNAINEALLNAGLMSHYIADLANPMHNSVDYDGWDSGHGGLHKYFEALVVKELDLKLSQEVYDLALKSKPYSEAKKLIPAGKKKSPTHLGLAMSFHAFKRSADLFKLDADHSRITKSTVNGKKRNKAKRKPAWEVRKHYHQFAVDQLSLAADAISDLWVLAWKEAGQPDLSMYRSYHYYFKPEFIAPNYLPKM